MSKALRLAIQSVGTELQWKLMSSDQFAEHYVSVALAMSEQRLRRVIEKLDDETFSLWTKKLWTEQDMEPNPDDYEAAYEESKPILQVLKRSLLYRLMSEKNNERRTNLQQQLALASLILQGPDALAAHVPLQKE